MYRYVVYTLILLKCICYILVNVFFLYIYLLTDISKCIQMHVVLKHKISINIENNTVFMQRTMYSIIIHIIHIYTTYIIYLCNI